MSAPVIALPAGARELIDAPEPAVLGTLNTDGSVHLCVMWVAREDDEPYTGREHDSWSDQDERALVRILPERVGLHD